MSEHVVTAVISFTRHARVNPSACEGALVADVGALHVVDVLDPACMRLIAVDAPLEGWLPGASVTLVTELAGRELRATVRGTVNTHTGEVTGDVPNVPVAYYRCVDTR